MEGDNRGKGATTHPHAHQHRVVVQRLSRPLVGHIADYSCSDDDQKKRADKDQEANGKENEVPDNAADEPNGAQLPTAKNASRLMYNVTSFTFHIMTDIIIKME